MNCWLINFIHKIVMYKFLHLALGEVLLVLYGAL